MKYVYVNVLNKVRSGQFPAPKERLLLYSQLLDNGFDFAEVVASQNRRQQIEQAIKSKLLTATKI
jgi:hypothetical protein